MNLLRRWLGRLSAWLGRGMGTLDGPTAAPPEPDPRRVFEALRLESEALVQREIHRSNRRGA